MDPEHPNEESLLDAGPLEEERHGIEDFVADGDEAVHEGGPVAQTQRTGPPGEDLIVAGRPPQRTAPLVYTAGRSGGAASPAPPSARMPMPPPSESVFACFSSCLPRSHAYSSVVCSFARTLSPFVMHASTRTFGPPAALISRVRWADHAGSDCQRWSS